MALEQAQAASDPAAASNDAGTPVIDAENVTMEQLDQLFETGSAELPTKPGGEKSQDEPPAKPKVEAPLKKEEPPVAKAGDEPPVVEEEEEVETEVETEVVESRSPEEIETAVTEAVEAVKTEGGDQAAQDAAAEAARQPVAEKPAESAKPKIEPEEKSRRFRVKDPIAQAALDLYKTFENTETPITLAEAERRVRGGDAAPKKEETAAAQEPDLQGLVTTLEAEVTDLKAKLDNAGGDEALFTKEIAQWTQALAEKTADLKLAQRDLKDQQAEAQAEAQEATTAWQSKVDESRARAIELYPDVANEETPLGKAVAERITAMRSKSHPDHNMLFTGSAPEIITKMVADEKGIQPVAKKKAPAPSVKKATQLAPKKVAPVSGARSSATSAPSTEDAGKKTVEYLQSDKVSLDELDDAFGAKDPLRMIAV